jgi:hypothetical protein
VYPDTPLTAGSAVGLNVREYPDKLPAKVYGTDSAVPPLYETVAAICGFSVTTEYEVRSAGGVYEEEAELK